MSAEMATAMVEIKSDNQLIWLTGYNLYKGVLHQVIDIIKG